MARSREGVIRQQTQMITLPERAEEPREEYRYREPNMALLKQLTVRTGGSSEPNLGKLLDRQPGTRRLARPLYQVLVPLAMLLFLADVAVRRLSRVRAAGR